jgi:hypothetical protein
MLMCYCKYTISPAQVTLVKLPANSFALRLFDKQIKQAQPGVDWLKLYVAQPGAKKR